MLAIILESGIFGFAGLVLLGLILRLILMVIGNLLTKR